MEGLCRGSDRAVRSVRPDGEKDTIVERAWRERLFANWSCRRASQYSNTPSSLPSPSVTCPLKRDTKYSGAAPALVGLITP